MTLEVSLEVKLEMTGWAEVGAEDQSCLKREVEEQEVPKWIATVVAATTTTAGKLEAAILKETDTPRETLEIKQGTLPLREGTGKETAGTTESEIKDQAHLFDIREGVRSLSVMKEERNEE